MSQMNRIPGEDDFVADGGDFAPPCAEQYGEVSSPQRFEPIPDGRYEAIVERVELGRSKKGQHLLKWQLRVTGPCHAGRKLWHTNVIETRQNLAYLKGDLEMCGLHLRDLKELPRRLGELLDVQLDIAKRTREGFENVFFNRRLASAPALDPADDIAF